MNRDTRMPRRGQLPQSHRAARLLAGHIQAALGGELGALLRHQAAVGGPQAHRDVQHLGGDRHLEVQARLHQRQQRERDRDR